MIPAEQDAMLAQLERRGRYLWAAEIAADRSVLDLDCGDGTGAALLHAAGATRVVATSPSEGAIEQARSAGGEIELLVAEPLALPFDADSFGLVTCFGPLETAADPEALLESIRQVLEPDGILVATLASPGRSELSADRAERVRRMLEHRFARVVPIAATLALTAAVGAADRPYSADGTLAGPPSLVLAGPEALKVPGPRTAIAEGEQVDSLFRSLSDWEERARGAEAEASAMRWEMLIAGEKLTALVNHLADLENRPGRRLGRLLRGKPARVLKQDVADPPRPWHRR